MNNIFFQSSLPRSGSTLFQNIMGQNPDFYVTPTSGVLELLYASRVNFTNSPEFKAQDQGDMALGFKSYCKSGMEGFYSGITDKKYVMDKSRGWGIHYKFLNEFYPDPKIVCMIRDPRAIMASMEKNFQKNQLKDSGLVDHANMVGTTTEKRIDIWSQSQPVGLAMERLYQMVNEGITNKMHIIKFEDLTRRPKDEMKKVYDYLDLQYYNHDYNNITQITVEDDSVYGIYGDHTIKKEVTPPTKDYNQILGVGPSNSVKNHYKWFYDEFKYF